MHADWAQIYEVWGNHEFHSESWAMLIVISLGLWIWGVQSKKLLPRKPASNLEDREGAQWGQTQLPVPIGRGLKKSEKLFQTFP